MSALADLATLAGVGDPARLADWLLAAPEADRLWGLALLAGRAPRRAVTTARLRDWAAEAAGLPVWLFDAAQDVARDMAETAALLVPPPGGQDGRTLAEWLAQVQRIGTLPDGPRGVAVRAAWDCLAVPDRVVLNHLLTGRFKAPDMRDLAIPAFARATGLPLHVATQRLLGYWHPDRCTWAMLIAPDSDDAARPYAQAMVRVEAEVPADLSARDWQAEPFWGGLPVQVILRAGQRFVWGGGDLLTGHFPELAALEDWLPQGTVIEGELLAWGPDGPMPGLARRLARAAPTKALMKQVPVRLMVRDLLERQGWDMRGLPLSSRRIELERLLGSLPPGLPLQVNPALTGAPSRALRDRALALGAEGLLVRRVAGGYPDGAAVDDWLHWPRDPGQVTALLLSVTAGGARADQFTEATFALRDGEDWLPVCTCALDLPEAAAADLASWVRAHTLRRYGPVRQVEPAQVFDLACDGVEPAPRRKAGITLRAPRLLGWRRDVLAEAVEELAALRAQLAGLSTGPGPG